MITEMRPNRVIAWESVPGSEVYNAGRVRFESVDGATRVDVFMTYNPPGGVAGHAIAALFDADPKSAMDDDLLKLKSLLGAGRRSSSEFPRPSGSYRRSGGQSGGMAAWMRSGRHQRWERNFGAERRREIAEGAQARGGHARCGQLNNGAKRRTSAAWVRDR